MNRNSCDKVKPTQKRWIGPTRRSVSGSYAFRSETSIQFESTLERDFIIKHEFYHSVLDMIPQPVEIPFSLGNQSYTYTPDFLVYYRLGKLDYSSYPKPMLVEVKPEQEWRKNWRKWLPKWKAAWGYAQQQGWCFHIYDESRIRDQTLRNIMFLERYKRLRFPVEESAWILNNLGQMGSASIDFLLSRHFTGLYRTEGLAHIWHLLASRQIDCDISRPLSESTELWVANHE